MMFFPKHGRTVARPVEGRGSVSVIEGLGWRQRPGTGRKQLEGVPGGGPSLLKGHPMGCLQGDTALERHSPLTRNAEIFILVSFIVFGNSVLVYKT